MIDLDGIIFVEYQDQSKEPLALVEIAVDIGQPIKPSTVTKKLAQRCTPTLPALTVLYKLSDRPNPTKPHLNDIESFRVRRLWPEPETKWERLTPKQWADRLVVIHQWSENRLNSEYPGNDHSA
jgi:hypothetical protein